MVIKVNKCNECPLLNKEWVTGEYSEYVYDCNHPNGIHLDIDAKNLNEMQLKCPLRNECISIRIK